MSRHPPPVPIPQDTTVHNNLRHSGIGAPEAAAGGNANDPPSSCLALLAEIDYGEEGAGGSDVFLSCGAPDGRTYRIPDSVTPKAWIQDKTSTGELRSGKTELTLPPGTQINPDTQELLMNGPPGLVNNPGLGTRNLSVRGANAFADGGIDDHQHHSRQLAVTGTRTVLVVKVILNDGQTTATESRLSDSVFGNGVDTVTLKSQYAACSHDQLIFDKAENRNTGGNIISNGAVTVTVDGTTTQGDATIRNAVTAELNSMFGVSSPNQLANHVMYCLPPGTMSGIAYAYINSWNSVYSDNWCTYLSTQMHELGHNINLAHANEGGTSYADQTGMMGYSYSQDNGPLMCFNAAKSFQLGWYSAAQVVVGDGGSYTGPLGSIVNYQPGSTPVIIKVNDPGSTTDYYINFNWKSGFNSGTVEAGNLVTVVKQASEGTGYAESDLVAKLNVGGSYGNALTVGPFSVTVQSISGSVATVQVLNNVDSCTVDSDCSDGIFCNGAETCVNGLCQNGSPPACGGATPFCDNASSSCVGCLVNNDCSDGLFCNGAETCVSNTCQPGTAPTCPFGCDENNDKCTECTFDSDCGGDLCAPKTCSSGTCVAGNDPCDYDQTCDSGSCVDLPCDFFNGSDCPLDRCSKQGNSCFDSPNCGLRNDACSVNSECCSGNCKKNGACS